MRVLDTHLHGMFPISITRFNPVLAYCPLCEKDNSIFPDIINKNERTVIPARSNTNSFAQLKTEN